MSFPRAKIHRFNDVAVCSPSPALYSPSPAVVKTSLRSSFRNKLAKLTHKSEKSPPASEVGSVITTNSTPCFRTPSAIPKKSKMLGFMKKSKPVNLFKTAEVEALKEKIVECHNKDESIRELTEQIEEMKLELAQKEVEERLSTEETSKEVIEKFDEIRKQLDVTELRNIELEKENQKCKTEFQKLQFEMTNLKEEQIISLHSLTVKHNCELEKLLRKIHDLNVELKTIKTDHTNISNTNETDLQIVMDNMCLLERYYNKTVEDFNTKIDSKNLTITNLNNNMKNLQEKLDKEEENTCRLEILLTEYQSKLSAIEMDNKKYTELIKELKETVVKQQYTIELEIDANKEKELKVQELHDLVAKHQLELSEKDVLIAQNNLAFEQTLLDALKQKESCFTEYQKKLTEKEHAHQQKLLEKDAFLEEKLVEKDLELFEELRIKDEEIKSLKTVNGLDTKECEQAHTNNEVVILKESMKRIKKNLSLEKQNCHNLKQSEIELRKQILQIQADGEARLKQVEEDLREMNMLSEMTWQDKFKHQEEESAAILKECQAISEYNIIQSEIEKNSVKQELAEKTEEIEKITEELKELHQQNEQVELTNVEFAIQVDELTKKINNYEKQIGGYEISLKKSLSTIETLKNRLLHSDTDVEVLKKELEACEEARLELEAKCNQFMDDIEFLEKLNEDTELQHDNTITIMHDHIHDLQDSLLIQLETFKKQANVEITELRLKLEEKEKTLQAIMDHLHTQQKVNNNAQIVITSANSELERLEEFATDFKFKNNRLETTIDRLSIELKASNDLIKELEVTVGNLEDELVRKSEEYDQMLRQVDHLQDKYDSYYNYCEYYKNKTVEYEKEIEEMSAINKKYIETCGKYDQLLQNHQLLTDVNDELERKVFELLEEKDMNENDELFNKNMELFAKNGQLEDQVRVQKKAIDKLKKEIQALTSSPKKMKKHPSCDKENILSPNRSLNMSFVDSPGPLRERNN